MPLDERMTLADGKPIQRRMMAAMAQQDCGQCGYDCHNYSKAIVDGEEARLNLCVPGGKETARKVKELAAELGGAPASKDAAKVDLAPAPKEDALPGYSRAAPVEVTFLSRRRLNKSDSEKSTYHIEIDLREAGITYSVGDSFGLFPQNHPDLVDAVIAAIGAPRDFPIGDKTLVEFLTSDASLGMAPDALFELVSYITGGEDPDGDVGTLDVLGVLEKFPNLRPDPEAFVEALDPLQPRLYSISSSHNATPGIVTLTVDHVRYVIQARTRRGVASSWLAERLEPGARIKAYVQKAHNFALPSSTDTPIIMVGPGTGVARSFTIERLPARRVVPGSSSGISAVPPTSFTRRKWNISSKTALCRSCLSPGRATAGRRPMSRIRCARRTLNSGPGSNGALTSTSAEMRNAWRVTSRKP